ncbi:MAG: hypothetical protein ABI977_02375 [Acidobacteriota bacterium]
MAEDLRELILSEDKSSLRIPTRMDEESSVVSLNMDSLNEDEKKRLYQAILAKNGMGLHEDRVKHGYSLEKLGSSEQCPRCLSPTERKCAYFVYATEAGTRVMMTPAGYFCPQCPTVIIDEALIREGITGGFHYRGVVGFHHDDQEMDILNTWNGEKPVFILDESEDVIAVVAQEMRDFLTRHQTQLLIKSQHSHKKDQKAAHRRALARAARKRNRQKR